MTDSPDDIAARLAAPSGVSSAASVVRDWTDPDGLRAAWARHPMAAQTPAGSDFLPDEPYELRTRSWWQPPDRAREETDEGWAIQRGELWWRYHELLGLNTNEGYSGASTNEIAAALRAALQPAATAAELVLVEVSSDRVAQDGRSLVEVTARPADGVGAGAALAWLGWCADEYVLRVEPERGWILWAEAKIGGARFRETELEDLRVDEPLDPALFEPPSDAGGS